MKVRLGKNLQYTMEIDPKWWEMLKYADIHISSDKNKKTSYAKCYNRVDGKTKYEKLHRVIMDPKKELVVDHLNGNGLDNTCANLRIATSAQNSMNRSINKNTSSGYKGVHKKRNKWQARIFKDGVAYHLGCYDTPEKASKAYKDKEKELYGKFAYHNRG